MALAERPYRTQVEPGGLTRRPFASPEAFGAGVGREVERLGGTLEQAAMQKRQDELQTQYRSQLADASRRAAELRLEIADKARQMEERPEPGVDHEKALGDYIDQRTREFLPSISNERVRQQIEPMLTDDRLKTMDRAAEYAAAERGKTFANNLEENLTLSGNLIRNNPSHDAYMVEVANWADLVAASPGSEADHAKRLAYGKDVLGQILLRSLPPDQVADEAKRLSQWIDPGKRATLEEGALSDLRTIEHEKRAQAAVGEKAMRDGWDRWLGDYGRNVAVDPIEGARMADEAHQLGDTSKEAEIRAKVIGATTGREYEKATVGQIDNAMAEIAAVPNWQQNPDLVAKYDGLDKVRERRRHAEPDIRLPNIGDGKDMARFEHDVLAEYGARGSIGPLLYGDFKTDLETRMNAGPQGQKDALAILSGFSPTFGYRLARELAPSDPVFQAAASYDNRRARELALSGRALAAEKGDDKVVSADDMAPQLKLIADVMAGYDHEYVQAAQETAMAIASALHRQKGLGRFDGATATEAVRLALDGQDTGGRRLGGIGEVNGEPFLLPTDMTQQDFDRRYWRLKGPSEVVVNKERLRFEDILKHYQPRAIGDGVYVWISPDGTVLTNDGQAEPVKLNIRTLKPMPESRTSFTPARNDWTF